MLLFNNVTHVCTMGTGVGTGIGVDVGMGIDVGIGVGVISVDTGDVTIPMGR